MSRRNILVIIGGIAAIGIIGAALFFGRIWFGGGSGEASEAISSEQLDAESDSQQVFRIVQEESEVSFSIYEQLMGNDKTVTGVTQEVAGDIAVDFTNPSNSEIGTIRINMRTLTTDDEFRNRAIRSDILLTGQDDYEFSEFVPSAIEGLPESVTIGEPFSFTVTGDLTLRGQPQTITFDVTVTPISETRIEGTATTNVNYPEVGIDIPRVPPQVANIADEVTLTLNFVAVAVTEEAS